MALRQLELDAEARMLTPDLADRLVARLREQGVLVRALVGHSVQISPPFVISRQQIDLLFDNMLHALSELAAELSHRFAA